MIPFIPLTTFYFIRHGQTDWNKHKSELCDQDDIPLNATGIQQAIELRTMVKSLGIKKVYSSPLERAKQTAQLVLQGLSILELQLHEGLGKIDHQAILYTFAEILSDSELPLIVSHGEVYRVLLHLLNIQTPFMNSKNGGLYFFSGTANGWTVLDLTPLREK